MTELNKHYKVAIEPLFHPNTASLAFQYSLSCLPIQPLLPSNTAPIGRQERLFLYIMGSKAMLNHTKKAREISKTDFYFVIGFYHLYDICMRHEGMSFRQEDMKTCFLDCQPCLPNRLNDIH